MIALIPPVAAGPRTAAPLSRILVWVALVPLRAGLRPAVSGGSLIPFRLRPGCSPVGSAGEGAAWLG
jgi:hypothetical protein